MKNTLKNYTKEGQKLPMFGIGPYLIYGIALLNAAVIALAAYLFKTGTLGGAWILAFRIVGALGIVLGLPIWFIAAVRSGMDENITENRLKTDGIYAWVRNPMYSGWWFAMTGIGLMWHNIVSLPLFLIDWAILTVVLKNTEEKWLKNVYGEEYEEYKSKVNRCIPWFPKR
ncbi:MAG: isoprenylcysteine carboxylmethyltransferase family protein [Clostridiales bacterium]|nr:isoprenylcysteine carboxylmethyltransferase family protein [Clostridiales bacterium]